MRFQPSMMLFCLWNTKGEICGKKQKHIKNGPYDLLNIFKVIQKIALHVEQTELKMIPIYSTIPKCNTLHVTSYCHFKVVSYFKILLSVL